MAAIIWTDVVAFSAGLAGLPVAAQDGILAWVNTALDVSVFDGEAGPKTKLARIYLAAHTASLGDAGSSGETAGPVTSETAGGLTRSYGAVATGPVADSIYGSTAFGRAYLMLVRTSVARAGVLLNGCA